MSTTTTPQVPGYDGLVPLGRGGCSEVYLARQERFDRWVAVKVLTFALADEGAQRRFLRECQLAGRVSSHPHVVTVHDAGLIPDGRPYIAMELYDGGSVADRLRGGGPLAIADALRIAVEVAGALESAHRAGVVHRDVKPGNVLLSDYGRAALGDFGLSILSEQEASAGVDALSPYHAPPEALERATPTPRSDVYSLASTLYAMLAGRAPHQVPGDDSLAAVLTRVLHVDVPPVGREDIPRSLDRALAGGLARDPERRTPSALAFAQALQQVQEELGLEPTRPVVTEPRAATPDPAPDVGGGAPTAGAGTAAAVPPPPPPPSLPDGDETVHRARVGRAWPPADGGAGEQRTRARRAPSLVAALVLAGVVAGGVTAVGASGGAEESAPSPTTETTAPATTSTTPPPAPAPPDSVPPETTTTAPPDPAPLPVRDAAASVAAPDSSDGCGDPTTYGAANAVDGERSTGWSIEGDGTGETLTLDLGGERRVRSVGLLPGYAKVDECTGVDRFPENRRPTAVTWTFDDGTEVSQPLEDAAEIQSIEVDATTSTVVMRIDGVTSDPRRDYTVVSEVAVEGG